MKNLCKARVISGKYEGREGIADFRHLEKTGNVSFYPKEGAHPYLVILKCSEVEKIES